MDGLLDQICFLHQVLLSPISMDHNLENITKIALKPFKPSKLLSVYGYTFLSTHGCGLQMPPG